MRKKKKKRGTIKCDKSTIKCNKSIVKYDVGIAEYDNGTIKCEKKIRELPNLTKEYLHVMLELHNVMIKWSM